MSASIFLPPFQTSGFLKKEGYYTKSEGISQGDYEKSSSITIKDIEINNNIEFVDDKYNEIFLNSNYLLSTRYQKADETVAVWGVLSIEEGQIKLNKLFESNLNDYIVNGNIRVLVNISNNIDLFNKKI